MTVSLDFILDTAMIPSVGKIAHNELIGIGRPKPTQGQYNNIPQTQSNTSKISNNGSIDGNATPSSKLERSVNLLPLPLGHIRRSSSFGGQGSNSLADQDGYIGRSGSIDGYSSTGTGSGSGTGGLTIRNPDTESRKGFEIGQTINSYNQQQHHQNGRSLNNRRQIRRSSDSDTIIDNFQNEIERAPTPPPKDRYIPPTTSRQTSGSSTQSSSGSQSNHNKNVTRSTSMTNTQSGIVLCRSSESRHLTKHLKALTYLTPPSRSTSQPSDPNTGILYPPELLIPLALILEALVFERGLLSSSSTIQDGSKSNLLTPNNLPKLPNGHSLQLTIEQGGNINWDALKLYIWSLGGIIDGILPYLQNHSPSQKKSVEELTKSIRVYVGKIKKLFGEVARSYVDNYGFMKGLWSENGMRGCAAEVGRWGDLFDV